MKINMLSSYVLQSVTYNYEKYYYTVQLILSFKSLLKIHISFL